MLSFYPELPPQLLYPVPINTRKDSLWLFIWEVSVCSRLALLLWGRTFCQGSMMWKQLFTWPGSASETEGREGLQSHSFLWAEQILLLAAPSPLCDQTFTWAFGEQLSVNHNRSREFRKSSLGETGDWEKARETLALRWLIWLKYLADQSTSLEDTSFRATTHTF